MKKKFGSYTINVEGKKRIRNPDGSLTLVVTLSGCIEIGLEIDEHTWRKDWFLSLFFNHDISKIRVKSIENRDSWSNDPCLLEVNTVTMVIQ